MVERRDSTADTSGERNGEMSRAHGEVDRAARREASRRAGDAGARGDVRGRGSDEGLAPADEAAGHPSQSDAAMSTIREAPRSDGSTTRGRVVQEWALTGEPRLRRSPARRVLALMLAAMVVGTGATVYVASCMSGETGVRGEAGAARVSAGGASASAEPTGGPAGAGGERSDSGAAGERRRAEGTDGAVLTSGAAGGSGSAVGGNGAAAGGGSGSAIGGAGGGSGFAVGGGSAVDGRPASADEGGAAGKGGADAGPESVAPGESLWVAVAQADGEVAERRRRIAAQLRALTSEPRILACLLGHVPMGVGRRTELTGSVVVAGDGEVVRATVRAGEGAVPAVARACVAAELEKRRFAAGPQAQLAVPLRLEIL
ncbi:hypothetical protein [Nannocystis radixulma]|uniref:AgmX/PglI C-terminal domain-containing protein n=1 Tax=Nannocystis radixulma TaxID=2995305 RepID=A0ABT5AZK5_9BACT|nr:hypothetical protein [Nannocystis radixulma]MDC0666880.1 hypothetical protein [Nannocystis radixulma]